MDTYTLLVQFEQGRLEIKHGINADPLTGSQHTSFSRFGIVTLCERAAALSQELRSFVQSVKANSSLDSEQVYNPISGRQSLRDNWSTVGPLAWEFCDAIMSPELEILASDPKKRHAAKTGDYWTRRVFDICLSLGDFPSSFGCLRKDDVDRFSAMADELEYIADKVDRETRIGTDSDLVSLTMAAEFFPPSRKSFERWTNDGRLNSYGHPPKVSRAEIEQKLEAGLLWVRGPRQRSSG